MMLHAKSVVLKVFACLSVVDAVPEPHHLDIVLVPMTSSAALTPNALLLRVRVLANRPRLARAHPTQAIAPDQAISNAVSKALPHPETARTLAR